MMIMKVINMMQIILTMKILLMMIDLRIMTMTIAN